MSSAGTKLYDGFSELHGGMNGNILASQIGGRQYRKGINIICRGGTIKTRPPFMGIELTFANFGDRRIYELGKFQGAATYVSLQGVYLVVAVSGNVFLIEPDTGKVANVTSAIEVRFNQYQDRLYFCQVERYMIVQDGINLPLIMDGTEADLANHTLPVPNQVPTGTIMAYGHGRLFIKVDKNTFVAGDINQPTVPTAVLQFTELQTQIGTFSLPADLGEITGMTFTQNFATGDGAGPLIVFCKNGFDAFAVYNPRSYWAENDISQVQARGIGSASPNCLVVTGDDIIMRTSDGIGSYGLFKTSDRRFINMSQELLPFEDQETAWARALSYGTIFDNRVLFTMVAEKVHAISLSGEVIDDYRFKALGVLDLAPLNGLTEISQSRMAVYDGAWTGPNPTAIVTTNVDDESRCFVFGKNDDGINTLFELWHTAGHDCGTIPINCRLYPKEMSFLDYTGKTPTDAIYYIKRLGQASVYVQQFQDDVEVKLWVCTDRRTDFREISSFTIHAPLASNEPPYTDVIAGQPQGRFRAAFPAFKDTMGDPVKGINILNGHQYEFCLEWNGIAEVKRMAVDAEKTDTAATIAGEKAIILPVEIRNDFEYAITCPVYVDSATALFGSFLIRRGRFDAWILRNLPNDMMGIDTSGQWVYPDMLGFGDDALQFSFDPFAFPDWSMNPDFPWPQGKEPDAIPPPTTQPLPAKSPTIPVPKVETPDGYMTVGGGPKDGDVAVQQLPKKQDPPGPDQGVAVELFCPDTVERGIVFEASVKLSKYMVSYTVDAAAVATQQTAYDVAVAAYRKAKASGDFFAESAAADDIDTAIASYKSAIVYKKQVIFQPWTNVKGIQNVSLTLVSPDRVQVGTVNDDTIGVTAGQLQWDNTGTAKLECVIAGGSLDPNQCAISADIAFEDGQRQDTFSSDVPVTVEAAGSVPYFVLQLESTIERGKTFVMDITAYHPNGNIWTDYDKELDFEFTASDAGDGLTPTDSVGLVFEKGVMKAPMTIDGGTDANMTFTITAKETGGLGTGSYKGGIGNVFILDAWGLTEYPGVVSPVDYEIPLTRSDLANVGGPVRVMVRATDPNYQPGGALTVSLLKNTVPHDPPASYSIDALPTSHWVGGMPPIDPITNSPTEMKVGVSVPSSEGTYKLTVTDPGTGRIGTMLMQVVAVPTRLYMYSGVYAEDNPGDLGSWWMYPQTLSAVAQYANRNQYSWSNSAGSYQSLGKSNTAGWITLKPSIDGATAMGNLRWTPTLFVKTENGATLTGQGVSIGITFNATTGVGSITAIINPNKAFFAAVTIGGDNTVLYTGANNDFTGSAKVRIYNVCTFVRSSPNITDIASPLYGGYSGGPLFQSIGSGGGSYPAYISVSDPNCGPTHPQWVLNYINATGLVGPHYYWAYGCNGPYMGGDYEQGGSWQDPPVGGFAPSATPALFPANGSHTGTATVTQAAQ